MRHEDVFFGQVVELHALSGTLAPFQLAGHGLTLAIVKLDLNKGASRAYEAPLRSRGHRRVAFPGIGAAARLEWHAVHDRDDPARLDARPVSGLGRIHSCDEHVPVERAHIHA
jgi:hypothetical protein